MLHGIDENRSHMVSAGGWLGDSQTLSEAAASLLARVAAGWEVERITDPLGEDSIIVVPTCDDPALPTFLLFEKDGMFRVGTIRDDAWDGDQAFGACSQAVAAIVTAIVAAMPGLPGGGWRGQRVLVQGD